MKHFTKWMLLITVLFTSATCGLAQQNPGTITQSPTGTASPPPQQSQSESSRQEKQTGGERKASVQSSKAEEKEQQTGVRCARLRKN